jgi:hypothetical protein
LGGLSHADNASQNIAGFGAFEFGEGRLERFGATPSKSRVGAFFEQKSQDAGSVEFERPAKQFMAAKLEGRLDIDRGARGEQDGEVFLAVGRDRGACG